jgi:YD repeat-containing protein
VNGFVTTWAFDEFGDHAVETRHDGTQSKVVEHRFASAGEASALPGAFSVLVTETTGEPRATTFYNYDGQVRRTVTGALDPARRVYVDSEYDGLGRMVRQSRPYFDNQTPSHFSTTIYQDMTSRPWRATSDEGTAVDYRYGDTWTSRSVVGTGRVQKTYSWFSGLAFEQREGTSNNYAVVKKRYDAAQRLTATIDDKGNRTTVAYDSRDRKIRQDDPDMGVWEYGYNSFGELAWQKDAKGQETSNTHDVLGRLRRVANASGVTEYSFDYRQKGKGKLAKISYAKPGQPAHYAQHIFYNQSHGRAEQINTCVGAGQAADCSNATLYKQVHKYDALGRLEYIRYPANQWLRHHYQQGRLKRLTLGSKTLWELDEQDASGQTRKVTHGNGLNTEYIYTAKQRLDKIAVLNGTTPTVLHSYGYQPADGLLTRRTDHNLDTTETYTYDGYARLKTVKKDYSALSDTITYDYDSLGNLISKPDLAALENVSIEYGQGTAGPHAVSSVGARDFSYDANGNLLNNGEQQVSWTAVNKPASITRGAHTTAFVYGPGNTRLQRIDGSKTTTYIGLYGGGYCRDCCYRRCHGCCYRWFARLYHRWCCRWNCWWFLRLHTCPGQGLKHQSGPGLRARLLGASRLELVRKSTLPWLPMMRCASLPKACRKER